MSSHQSIKNKRITVVFRRTEERVNFFRRRTKMVHLFGKLGKGVYFLQKLWREFRRAKMASLENESIFYTNCDERLLTLPAGKRSLFYTNCEESLFLWRAKSIIFKASWDEDLFFCASWCGVKCRSLFSRNLRVYFLDELYLKSIFRRAEKEFNFETKREDSPFLISDNMVIYFLGMLRTDLFYRRAEKGVFF